MQCMDIAKPLLITQLSLLWTVANGKGEKTEKSEYVKQHLDKIYELSGGEYDDIVATDYLNEIRRSLSLNIKPYA